ncbi:MAG: hypothetical protein WC373_05620 [Smithella sp.]|jgi:hypothetical protein
MKAKYLGIIHQVVSYGKIRHGCNYDFVENCKTVCGLDFSEMGLNFNDNDRQCEKCNQISDGGKLK